MARVTIKDIAKALNVHHSTVSRALRNDARVQTETRALISKYAHEHGYQVNKSALNLRANASNVIAIIVPNINHNFFSNIISRVTNLARTDGYIVTVFQSNENLSQEKHIVKTIIQNNFAGVIASVSMETSNGDHFLELSRFSIPLVLFDRVCDIPVPKVLVRNYEIVKEATKMLVDKGYQRIVHLSCQSGLNVFNDRQRGYRDAIAHAALPYSKVYEANKSFTIEDGRLAARQLFSHTEKPDAFICDSYNLFLGLYLEIRLMGMQIGHGLGIICFGENPSMEAISPSISAIVQPDNLVANNVYRLLKEKIGSANGGENQICEVDAQIIVRQSF